MAPLTPCITSITSPRWVLGGTVELFFQQPKAKTTCNDGYLFPKSTASTGWYGGTVFPVDNIDNIEACIASKVSQRDLRIKPAHNQKPLSN